MMFLTLTENLQTEIQIAKSLHKSNDIKTTFDKKMHISVDTLVYTYQTITCLELCTNLFLSLLGLLSFNRQYQI